MVRSVAALVVVLSVACTTASPPSTLNRPSTSAESPTVASDEASTIPTQLDCVDPIGTSSALPAGFEDIGGAVGLQTAASDHVAMQTAATSSGDPSARLFAKAALMVKRGARAEIIGPPASMGSLSVEWGNTTNRARTAHLTVGPCEGPDSWLVYPGGYYVPDPSCVHVNVRVAGIDHSTAVGVGAPCPGQEPPPQPTES